MKSNGTRPYTRTRSPPPYLPQQILPAPGIPGNLWPFLPSAQGSNRITLVGNWWGRPNSATFKPQWRCGCRVPKQCLSPGKEGTIPAWSSSQHVRFAMWLGGPLLHSLIQVNKVSQDGDSDPGGTPASNIGWKSRFMGEEIDYSQQRPHISCSYWVPQIT